jgi:hypothetical protein
MKSVAAIALLAAGTPAHAGFPLAVDSIGGRDLVQVASDAPRLKCKSYSLDGAHDRVALRWVIFALFNDGPATVSIRTDADKSLNDSIAQSHTPTMFFGDNRYAYYVALADSGARANFRICR